MESLLKDVSSAIPILSFDDPPLLFSVGRDLAALLLGFCTWSPVASEAPVPSSTSLFALPDSVMDEQEATTPSPKQQQAQITPLSFVKVGGVEPGETLDMQTGDLKAPDAPGRYVSYWKLIDGTGQRFGTYIWIEYVRFSVSLHLN
ncbi:hypothetical protein BDR03DRAFT_1014066 [Suillus americanus]|nr:hypothetical protein BDR03DRAFT_1014066 [Suillus americanus]